MQEQDLSVQNHRRKKLSNPRKPTGLIVAAWISTLVSYVPSYFISIIAYFCALGCGIALLRHKNKSKVTKINGWIITFFFAIRFFVLILFILDGLGIVRF